MGALPKKQVVIDYGAELRKHFERWEKLYVYGCSDPFYTDGANLAMVRNHILIAKSNIEKNLEPENYPEIYYKELPPVVPDDYMARSDEIKANAKATLEICRQNADYQYLSGIVDQLDVKEKKDTYIVSVLASVTNLEAYIEADDLVGMRRNEIPERTLDSFCRCAGKVRMLKRVIQ